MPVFVGRCATVAVSAIWMVSLVGTVGSTRVRAQAKDDRLVLTNGDHLVGEIKGLSQGELRFKADYVLEDARVDWRQVHELESRRVFRVAVADGRRLTGSIVRHADGRFTIATNGAGDTLPWSDIIEVRPVETSVWAQMTGNVNSGYSYTSDANQTQFSASGAVGYAAEHYAFDVTASSIFNAQSSDTGGDTSTTRDTLDLANEVPFAPHWFGLGLLGFLTSDQQELLLRTTAGGAIGRWFARTEATRVALTGGLVYTREQYRATDDVSGRPEPIENLEGVVSLQYVFHKFKTVDIQSRFVIYPSLSTPGRVRVSYAPMLNIEIVRNLYWNFTLYENYDSRPPVNANKNDFGITNSVGWKF